MEKLYKFPLKMHVGLPSTPVVKEGQEVKRGECIAEPNGLGSKIHSSITGKVNKVTDSEIIIAADEDQTLEYVQTKECSDIAEAVFEAGIVGAGGAGFPTHVKLRTNIKEGFIIANCVECEPALHHNIRLLETSPELIIKGIRYAIKATGALKGYVAIKAKNKEAISEINKHLGTSKDIEIKELKDLYPMGEERAVIHEIFGKWLTPNQLPTQENCVVLNCETLANITRAVEERKPVIDKDITIAGKLKGGNEAHVLFQVPIGISIGELIDRCGGIDGEFGEIVIGGPYTGKSQEIDTAVVTKISGGAIVTIPFPKYEGSLGLLVCACGADEERLRDIAGKMGSSVVGVTKCKNVEEVRGINKCLTPGDCPGQAQGILFLKKKGAKRVLISNCNDCSNTVMCCAPKMGLPVYHHTDHIFRTIDHTLTRRLPVDNEN